MTSAARAAVLAVLKVACKAKDRQRSSRIFCIYGAIDWNDRCEHPEHNHPQSAVPVFNSQQFARVVRIHIAVTDRVADVVKPVSFWLDAEALEDVLIRTFVETDLERVTGLGHEARVDECLVTLNDRGSVQLVLPGRHKRINASLLLVSSELA